MIFHWWNNPFVVYKSDLCEPMNSIFLRITTVTPMIAFSTIPPDLLNVLLEPNLRSSQTVISFGATVTLTFGVLDQILICLTSPDRLAMFLHMIKQRNQATYQITSHLWGKGVGHWLHPGLWGHRITCWNPGCAGHIQDSRDTGLLASPD